METASATERKSPFSFSDKLAQIVPESLMGRLLFWGALSSIFFLFTVGVAFMHGAVFAPYLPFFALLGGVVCLRWKTLGLGASYGALLLLVLSCYKQIPLDGRLWHMGLIFALAVDFFILLLTVEEMDRLLKALVEVGRSRAKELNQAQLHMQQQTQEWAETQTTLESEIEQLKAEAEQRRIERQHELHRFELVQSEIEMLTRQKTEILAEAKRTRAEVRTEVRTVDPNPELEEKIVSLAQELENERNKPPIVETQRVEVPVVDTARIQELESQLEVERNKPPIVETQRVEVPVVDTARIQELESQLEAERNKPPIVETVRVEVPVVETVRVEVPVEIPVEVAAEKDGAVRQVEGQYKQLRTQFEEKNQILTNTRRELFAAQEKLLTLEHNEKLLELSEPAESARSYELTILALTEEILTLEEEITTLEGLVSHALSQ